MSADLLREAASLMRERATAAIASLSDNVPEWHSVRALMGEGKTEGDAEHIASWHPAVALAVADWLEFYAFTFESREAAKGDVPSVAVNPFALAVARAYLGSDS